jgi:Na+/H+ antiporter NhaD/arsenite permease-like protein
VDRLGRRTSQRPCILSPSGNMCQLTLLTLADPRHTLIAGLIFLASYLVFAVGRFPGTRIDRPAAAVIGAAMMFAFRVLGPEQGLHSINYATVVLLFAMMVVVAGLHLAGFFEWVTDIFIAHVKPGLLLPVVIFTSGILSAFLVNDIVCLLMAPLVMQVSRQLSRRATPYLLALATASNIGSTAAITGNPQNILIGSVSHISYVDFLAHLGPVAVVGLFLDWAILHLIYFHAEIPVQPSSITEPTFVRPQSHLVFPAIVTLAVLAGFLAGLPPALVAAVGAAVLLVHPRYPSKYVYNEVDWSLLVFFVGLFLIVGGAEQSGIAQQFLGAAERLNLHNRWIFSGVVVLFSNVVSNVPAVMLLKDLLPHFKDQHHFWLLLAMTSTLAGNLTITGSVANIIVVEKARAESPVSFAEYLKAGIPVTVATVIVGVIWLSYV